MIRSMTGYGRAELTDGTGRWTAEIRSVNHRFCEISLRLPRFVQHLEQRARTLLQDRLMRGKITVNVVFEGQAAPDAGGLRLDIPLLDRYFALLAEVRERFHLAEPVSLATLAGLPDVLVWEAPGGDDAAGWPSLERVLELAGKEITRMKELEGGALASDFRQRLGMILGDLGEVEARAPVRIEEAQRRLQERLGQLLSNGPVDPGRLAQEVAIYVDRMDCTEECVRLRTHCDHFEKLIGAAPSAGRRLNFLLQEMNREANTIGSKASDAVITQKVMCIKEELEKLREQIQNIE
ncbi:MAG TPA: YicC/YloC family endoribonuclease [Candidatus Saccharimonadales bacterium]|nr:YicC/YloC family endoribonuclease [Candidatus Saccharimonadales bacterium]